MDTVFKISGHTLYGVIRLRHTLFSLPQGFVSERPAPGVFLREHFPHAGGHAPGAVESVRGPGLRRAASVRGDAGREQQDSRDVLP